MAFKQGAGSGATTSATTIVQAFGSNVTAGSALVCLISYADPTTSITSCLDTQSNTWTQVSASPFDDTVNGQTMHAFVAPNANAGATTVTVTIGASRNFRGMVIGEFDGVATASPVDGTPVFNATNGTSLAAGSITTTTAGCQVVGIMMNDDGGTAVQSAGGSFTKQASGTWDGTQPWMLEDQTQVSAGAISVAFAQASSQRNLLFGVALKASGGAAATQPIIVMPPRRP